MLAGKSHIEHPSAGTTGQIKDMLDWWRQCLFWQRSTHIAMKETILEHLAGRLGWLFRIDYCDDFALCYI